MARIIWIAIIALVLLLGFFLLSLPESQSEGAAAEVDHKAYAKNIKTKYFRPNGQLHYSLSSDLVTHSPQQNQIHFKMPALLIYPKNNQPPWQINAENGHLRTTANDSSPLPFPDFIGSFSNITGQVILSGNVVVQRVAVDQSFISLSTQRISFYPATEIATTDVELSILFTEGHIKAQGGSANLDTGFVELTGKLNQPIQSLYQQTASLETPASSLHISSSYLSIVVEDEKIVTVHAAGKPVHFRRQQDGESDPMTGSARQIDYDPNSRMLSLEHKANVHQGQKSLRGDIISYNLRTQVAKIESFNKSGSARTP